MLRRPVASRRDDADVPEPARCDRHLSCTNDNGPTIVKHVTVMKPEFVHTTGGTIMARTSDTTSDTTGKGHAKVKQGTPGGAGGKGQSGSDAGKTQSAKRDKSGYGSTGSKRSGGTGSSQGSGGGSGGTHG